MQGLLGKIKGTAMELKSPVMVAQAILKGLPSQPFIEKCEVGGPGILDLGLILTPPVILCPSPVLAKPTTILQLPSKYLGKHLPKCRPKERPSRSPSAVHARCDQQNGEARPLSALALLSTLVGVSSETTVPV